MIRQHLFKQSKSYAIVKKYAVFIYEIFYSEICIIGQENIPADEPVIFAPNHQNGLMDALAAGLPLEKQPVFMARADIFNEGFTAKILHFLKIIPVFRLKDGAEKLSRNDEYFNTALEALKHGMPVIIMPEGGHEGVHRLKPLKKGVVRFALDAQENLKADLKIIPVGIDYSNYHDFRAKLLVIYGKPIEVGQYLTEYRENPQIAFNILRNRLSEELKKLMIHVDHQEFYQLIMETSEIFLNQLFADSEADYSERFLRAKNLTDRLNYLAETKPEVLNSLSQSVQEYNNGLKRLDLNDRVLDFLKPERRKLWMDVSAGVVFLPFAGVTAMINIVPAFICNYLSGRSEDPQFRSSFRYAAGALVFPVFYLLFLAFFPIPLYTKVLVLLPMPVLIPLTFDFYLTLKNQWMKFRYFSLVKSGSHEINALRTLREKILRIVDDLMQ